MDYRDLDEVLIFSDSVKRGGDSLRALQAGARRGQFVRLRRGVYVPGDVWHGVDARTRHLLRIKAILPRIEGDPVVAGLSAAALWDMPIEGPWPDYVTLLELPKTGGKSEPGVKRTVAGAARASTTEMASLRVTSLARTALDLARMSEFGAAVATLDWARWRKNPLAVSREELLDEHERARFRTGARSVLRAIEWSTDLSDSFGESKARVQIRQLGFPEPELQRRFVDGVGAMEVDFYFSDADVAAEFDGRIKYTRSEFTGGDPSAVVWREKLREDRLRRMVSSVVRLVASDVVSPVRLARLLLDAGVRRIDPVRRPTSRVGAPVRSGASTP